MKEEDLSREELVDNFATKVALNFSGGQDEHNESTCNYFYCIVFYPLFETKI